MRRTWVKLYVETLRSSMISELSPEQRWMFVGLLLMAGDSPIPGTIYARKDENGKLIGYPDAILAFKLGVHESAIQPGLARMVEKGKITIDDAWVISICNWRKYQSEYERTRNAPSRVVQKYGVEGDVDRDVDVEHHIGRKAEITFNFDTNVWDGISKEDMEDWAKRFPVLDINGQLAEMRDWLLDNPNRAKKRYRTFITKWMKRSLDDRKPSAPGRPAVNMRVGEAKRQDHSSAYWAEHRRLQAQGVEGEALTEAMKKWEGK